MPYNSHMEQCIGHMIIGLRGTVLADEERRWLTEVPPLGVILFGRNIENPGQLRSLLDDVRSCAGKKIWAVIDEEGGRVNRIPWLPFSHRRPAAEYGQLMRYAPDSAKQAVYADSLSVGHALTALGFTHSCAPVLDIFHPRGHGIIGERAYAADTDTVGQLGEACMRGLSGAGIEAVGKHFPGHGRADADSHIAVPEVDAPLDILLAEAQPFHRLVEGGIKHMMTAHVIYRASLLQNAGWMSGNPTLSPFSGWNEAHGGSMDRDFSTEMGQSGEADRRSRVSQEPRLIERQVATWSPFWLKDVLRRQFGFSGRIWSDDLCMAGAGGDIRSAANKALDAGCDVLLVCEPRGVVDIYHDP